MQKTKFTRQDISEILKSIGAPGEKHKEKIEAVQKLGLKNVQGYGVELTLEGYEAF